MCVKPRIQTTFSCQLNYKAADLKSFYEGSVRFNSCSVRPHPISYKTLIEVVRFETKSHLILQSVDLEARHFSNMKVGIVNAGNIGLNLAISWIRHGHEIMLSKDTHPEKIRERTKALALNRGLSETELARFNYGSLVDAAKFGDAVVISVYFPRLEHVLKELQRAGVTLSGKIVIDTMNPLNVDANFHHYHDLEYMQRTSTTEEIRRSFPEAIVFKAFNNLTASRLDVQKWPSDRVPPIIFVGGNSSSTDIARKLIEDAGFKPRFAGDDLTDARLLERLGILAHRLAENEYQGDLNIGFDIVQSKVEN